MKFFLFFFINLLSVFSNNIITLTKNNFVAIDKEISSTNVNEWIRSLNNITTNPVYLYINSNGGSVDAGELLINQINYKKFLNYSVECVAQKAYSMAFHILQSCDKRYITPSSKVMQHQISLSIPNNQLENILNYLEMLKQIRDNLEIISSNRIGISLEDYRNKVSSDWWLYGENIIINNVADEIVYVGCSSELYNETKKINKEYFDLNSFSMIKKKTTVDLCPIK